MQEDWRWDNSIQDCFFDETFAVVEWGDWVPVPTLEPLLSFWSYQWTVSEFSTNWAFAWCVVILMKRMIVSPAIYLPLCLPFGIGYGATAASRIVKGIVLQVVHIMAMKPTLHLPRADSEDLVGPSSNDSNFKQISEVQCKASLMKNLSFTSRDLEMAEVERNQPMTDTSRRSLRIACPIREHVIS